MNNTQQLTEQQVPFLKRQITIQSMLQDRILSKGSRETRIRWHNLGTTAKQATMVWACVANRRQWLDEEMYGVWSGGC